MGRKGCIAGVVRLALLLPLLGLAAGRKTMQVSKRTEPQSCSSRKGSSAIAVSVVYAECQGDVVLAAESLAQAAVSGCGDAYAAGVGISIANLAATGPDGLAGVLSAAFSGAVSVSRTIGDAAAVSQGIAVAFASALPSEIPAVDFLSSVASAIAEVADGAGCPRATAVSFAFYNGLIIAAPETAPVFALEIGQQVIQCKKLVKLASLAAADDLKSDAKLARLIARVSGGKSRGRTKLPLFSAGVDGQVKSSSLAVTIAEVSCPAAGSGTVAAVAIALAAKDDADIASAAIAGVLTVGVDITAIFEQTAMLVIPQRKAAVQAFARAIVAVDAQRQQELIGYMGVALENIGLNSGCATALDVLMTIKGTDAAGDTAVFSVPAVSADQLLQLCTAVRSCPMSCPGIGVVGR